MKRFGGVLVVLALFVACSDLKSAQDEANDAGAPVDAAGPGIEAGQPSPDAGGDDDDMIQPIVDAGPVLPPNPDAGVGPEIACEDLQVRCYDFAPANIIDVPGEMTLADAFATAKSGDTIQMTAGYIDGTMQLPAGVTLHGCIGATVRGTLLFGGGSGLVEGMMVTGQIGADTSGDYTVRKSYFLKSDVADQAGLLLSANFGAAIKITVSQSNFSARDLGIYAGTGKGAATGSYLRVENCLFDGVATAVKLARVGTLSSPLRARIASSTFYGFSTAISMKGLGNYDGTVDIAASLFGTGARAVEGDSLFGVSVSYSFTNDVVVPWGESKPPNPFVDIEPGFVNTGFGAHDFRLKKGSAAVDRIPVTVAVPSKDIYGCPRPGGAAVDPGAYESQPP